MAGPGADVSRGAARVRSYPALARRFNARPDRATHGHPGWGGCACGGGGCRRLWRVCMCWRGQESCAAVLAVSHEEILVEESVDDAVRARFRRLPWGGGHTVPPGSGGGVGRGDRWWVRSGGAFECRRGASWKERERAAESSRLSEIDRSLSTALALSSACQTRKAASHGLVGRAGGGAHGGEPVRAARWVWGGGMIADTAWLCLTHPS